MVPLSDAAGRRHHTLCWTYGRETAPMRLGGDDLRRHGWTPPQTLQIPDWCGCSTVPPGADKRRLVLLVPIWGPDLARDPRRAGSYVLGD